MTIEKVTHIETARKENRRVNLKKLAAQEFNAAMRRYPGGVKITLWGGVRVVSRAILRAVFMAHVAQMRAGSVFHWAGKERIAEIACVSENTAYRAREALRLLGLLDWLSGKGGGDDGLNPCLYRVNCGPEMAGQAWPEGASTGEIIAELKGKKRERKRGNQELQKRAEDRRALVTEALNNCEIYNTETGEIYTRLKVRRGTVESFEGPLRGPQLVRRTGKTKAPAPQQLFFSGMEPVARPPGKKRVIHRPGVDNTSFDSKLQGARMRSSAADPGA